MTKEDLPVTPRPSDSFTASDGMRLFTMIDGNLKRISSTFEDFSNRLANIQRQSIKMIELLEIIESESAESRIGRLELEIEEAQRERDLAERNLQAVTEKLNQKQTIKDKSADTGERIKAVASDVLADADRKKRESREAWLEDLRRSAIKTALNILVAGSVTGGIAFIWFLVQLYLNRTGP
jgi:hypothetical protein